MDPNNTELPETFEAFYKSFSYGSRCDLAFKFIANLSEADASDFFREFLLAVINGIDRSDNQKVSQLILKWQRKAYDSPAQFPYASGPFTPLQKPLADSKIALMASTGHFISGQDPNPFGVQQMTQDEAIHRISEFIRLKPEILEIPVDTPPENLRVRHGGYDIRAAQADPNTVFPYKRLLDIARSGIIGSLAEMAYTFVGACSQMKLQKETIPAWLIKLKAQKTDGLILVPV